jgi:hypothetical protein
MEPFTEERKARVLPEEENISDVSSTLPTFSGSVAQARGLGKESRGRRNQYTGIENDAWIHQKGETGPGVETWQRAEMRDDTSEVLGDGDATSADVTSGRYLTPMEFVSQQSKCLPVPRVFGL